MPGARYTEPVSDARYPSPNSSLWRPTTGPVTPSLPGVAELWIPTTAVTAMQREQADRGIDAIVRAVRDARPRLVQAANPEGARLEAAAALLVRALQLLSAARGADHGGSTPAVELAVRSGFEVVCRGRFLVLSPDAEAEFAGMIADFQLRNSEMNQKIGQEPAPLPPFLAHADPSQRTRPRNLWRICGELDELERRDLEDLFSARRSYRPMFAWLSDAAVHGGLGAVRSFVIEREGVLHLVDDPGHLTSDWPIPILAAHVGELARVVLEAFGLDSEPITATGFVLPAPTPAVADANDDEAAPLP